MTRRRRLLRRRGRLALWGHRRADYSIGSPEDRVTQRVLARRANYQRALRQITLSMSAMREANERLNVRGVRATEAFRQVGAALDAANRLNERSVRETMRTLGRYARQGSSGLGLFDQPRARGRTR